jgi:hypothetical protein
MVSWVGCGSDSTAGRPKTYPVTGTVTLDGKSVAGATVTFQLTGASGSAVGVTDAAGKYTLTTFGGGDGAQAGDYAVAVVKYDVPPVQGAASGGLASGEIDESSYNAPAEVSADQPATPKNLLPEKYANAATSGLTAKVNETANNQFDFKLEP